MKLVTVWMDPVTYESTRKAVGYRKLTTLMFLFKEETQFVVHTFNNYLGNLILSQKSTVFSVTINISSSIHGLDLYNLTQKKKKNPMLYL